MRLWSTREMPSKIDSILESVGAFGLYQFLQITLSSLGSFFGASQFLIVVFHSITPQFRYCILSRCNSTIRFTTIIVYYQNVDCSGTKAGTTETVNPRPTCPADPFGVQLCAQGTPIYYSSYFLVIGQWDILTSSL